MSVSRIVDINPSCGNMLAGVAPFAIETGMFPAQDGETRVMIYNVNTEARIEAIVQTPGRAVRYTGDARIDGVPGTAAPIILNFMDVVGSISGKLLPTGDLRDVIDGIEVTCIDVAMPMIMMRAKDFGLTGTEGRAEINPNKELFARIEPIRREAGKRMGFGDVSDKVIPKVGLLSPPRDGGTIASRYLTPHALHAAHAVTGAVCVATACALEGSIAFELAKPDNANPRTIWIEHPSGQVDVRLETKGKGADLDVIAGTLRTARPIMKGEVLVPRKVLQGSGAKRPAKDGTTPCPSGRSRSRSGDGTIRPNLLQQFRRRMPIRRHPVLRLLDPDRVAQIEIDAAFEVVHRVAEFFQLLLQRDALAARKLGIVGGPRGAERSRAARAIRQMPGREREHVGRVVALDDLEILSHEECRAGRAAREEQDRLAVIRQRLAVGPPDAERGPFGVGRTAAAMVEALRNDNLMAPAGARLPAPVPEKIRDRCQHVRHAGPDVLAPVAVEIDRERTEIRRHELRLSHRAGP